jgi:hypothetical protein
MELNNVKTKEFRSTGLLLIQQLGEILTLVRYPFSAGDKDFILINSDNDFKEFLDNRKPKDSVTIFKTVETLADGIVTQDFIDKTLTQLKLIESADWLVILPRQQVKNWTFANTEEELREVLHDNIGHYVKILEEPDWLDDKKVIHGYEPDEDGQIRPGSY